MTPLRLNLLIIAGLITVITLKILELIPAVIALKLTDGGLIIGTLLGLLGSCITALSALGTTLLNDRKQDKDRNRDGE